MTRDELLVALRQQADLFRTERVRRVSLFGSRARGDERADSDVDLLVEYEPDARISLIAYCRLQLDLSEALGKEVHLKREPATRTPFRDRIEEDLIAVL